ncbi:MAG: hypothetical protein K8J09_00895 [Planctomycetes bacterium]|nr:hypothetical protein [Planctomycetota bacterium]MCC7397607.1 hypothetical protein [Planctomycetota bacterium]
MRPFLLLFSFASSLAPVTLAQASGGPVLALPHGFSIDPSTPLPGTSTKSVVFADVGIDAVLPPALPPGVPDFAAFLAGVPVDVDALSLGWDWVVANSVGEAVVPPGHWGAITFSVTRGTTGLPGSLIAAATAEPDGAAADVFAYVLPGSSLPPPFVGIPFRAQDSRETSTFVGGVPGSLDAHDLYIALLYQENPQLAALLPPPTIFFSVTAASVPSIPLAWTAVPALRSGATVFASTWQPATSTWSAPGVAFAPSFFGLLPSEDLDALALDLLRGTALFSTDRTLPPPAGPRDPILFTVLGSSTHWIYRLPGTGTPISAEVALGLGVDDIDGICSLDPGSPAQPSQIRLPFMMGTIAPALPTGLPTQLQASVWRRFDPTLNQEFAETWMTGWPPPGTAQPSLAIVGASVAGSLGPYSVVGVFVRPQPANPFAGHPEQFRIHIPPAVSLSGLELHFLWAAMSPSTFDLSHPVGLLL